MKLGISRKQKMNTLSPVFLQIALINSSSTHYIPVYSPNPSLAPNVKFKIWLDLEFDEGTSYSNSIELGHNTCLHSKDEGCGTQ